MADTFVKLEILPTKEVSFAQVVLKDVNMKQFPLTLLNTYVSLFGGFSLKKLITLFVRGWVTSQLSSFNSSLKE